MKPWVVVAFVAGGAAGFAAGAAWRAPAPEPEAAAKDPAQAMCMAQTPRLLGMDDPDAFAAFDKGVRDASPAAQGSWQSCLSDRVRVCAVEAATAAALQQGSPDVCGLLPPDVSLPCIEEVTLRLARDKGDPAICERMRDSPAYARCKAESLKNRPVDADYGVTCDTLESPEERRACHVRIFTEKVRREGRVAACLKLESPGQRTSCVAELGAWLVESGRTRGAAACDGLPDDDGLHDQCLRFALREVVRASGDAGPCKAIRDTELRRDCEDNAWAGQALHELQLATCDRIAVVPTREQCRREVTQQLLVAQNASASLCLQLPVDDERRRCTDQAVYRQAMNEGLFDIFLEGVAR